MAISWKAVSALGASGAGVGLVGGPAGAVIGGIVGAGIGLLIKAPAVVTTVPVAPPIDVNTAPQATGADQTAQQVQQAGVQASQPKPSSPQVYNPKGSSVRRVGEVVQPATGRLNRDSASGIARYAPGGTNTHPTPEGYTPSPINAVPASSPGVRQSRVEPVLPAATPSSLTPITTVRPGVRSSPRTIVGPGVRFKP